MFRAGGGGVSSLGNPRVQDVSGSIIRNQLESLLGPSGTWGRGRGPTTYASLPDWLSGPFTTGIGAVNPNLPFRVAAGTAATPGRNPILATLNALPGSPGGSAFGSGRIGLR